MIDQTSSGMSSRRSRSGGELDRDHVEPVVEILAEAALGDRALEVAVGGGDDAHVDADGLASTPTRSNVPSCSTRSSLACTSMPSSPISSRNSVPPCASSKRPARAADGAGERALLVAEELALDERRGDRGAVDPHERRPLRGLRWCSARASSSLPVPVSPSRSTAASVGATCATCASTWRMARLWPDDLVEVVQRLHLFAQRHVLRLQPVAQRPDLVDAGHQFHVPALAIERVGQNLADDAQPVHVDRRPLAEPREISG